MTITKTKRNQRRRVERMSVVELEKVVRTMRPEINAKLRLLNYAEQELERRNHAHDTDVAGATSP